MRRSSYYRVQSHTFGELTRTVALHAPVHAISPGPLATRTASGIPEFDELLQGIRAFFVHDAARLITGETLYIDGGYHIID